MTPFVISIKNQASKFIAKQDQKTQRLIKEKIERIAADPLEPTQSKWLAGHGETHRSARVGGNRIIFEVNVALRTLTILVIDSRGQVYDRF